MWIDINVCLKFLLLFCVFLLFVNIVIYCLNLFIFINVGRWDCLNIFCFVDVDGLVGFVIIGLNLLFLFMWL